VHRAHREISDLFNLLILRAPFRCNDCRARFWDWFWKV
jgi:hypothetical protein